MLLGCIADDFTGATDLANMLVRGGMRTIQTIGIPEAPLAQEVDAVVVALKSRTIPAADAVAQSLAALAWLRNAGCQADLLQVLLHLRLDGQGQHRPRHRRADGCARRPTSPSPARRSPRPAAPSAAATCSSATCCCPSRGMKDHPLTPMTDANLVRVLQAQTQAQGRAHPLRHAGARCRSVARADRGAAGRGRRHCRRRCAVGGRSRLHRRGLRRPAAGDRRLRRGARDRRSITARSGRLGHAATAAALPRVAGRSAVLSGSCSVATNGQVAHWMQSRPAFRIDPLSSRPASRSPRRRSTWAERAIGGRTGADLRHRSAATT